MKKIVLLFALCIGQMAFGQDLNMSKIKTDAQTELTALKNSLQLTSKQEEDIKNLLEGIHYKNAALAVESGISEAQRKEEINANNATKREIINSYLDSKQQQKYAKIKM